MSEEIRKEFDELFEIQSKIDECENALSKLQLDLNLYKIKSLEHSSNIDALLKKIDDYKKKTKE